MASISPQIKGCVNLILDYKMGKRNLEETLTRVEQLSGLSRPATKAFLIKMRRDNLITFPGTKKK
jgi:hypothetical protein